MPDQENNRHHATSEQQCIACFVSDADLHELSSVELEMIRDEIIARMRALERKTVAELKLQARQLGLRLCKPDRRKKKCLSPSLPAPVGSKTTGAVATSDKF